MCFSELSEFFRSLSLESPPVTQGPTFPMPQPPSCRRCGWVPQKRDTVSQSNCNGNAGRPYYICIKCKGNQEYTIFENDQPNGWISWDDGRGVHPRNPKCNCGIVCRQDRAGSKSSRRGYGFWTCASGSCNYFSFRTDGLTDDEAWRAGAAYDHGFKPWLF